MRGARARDRRRRALVWWCAMLPHLKKPPRFDEFVGEARPVRPPGRDWRADLAAWETYAAMRKQ